MKKILIPDAELIVAANKYICEQDGNPHHRCGLGKVEPLKKVARPEGFEPPT